MSNSNSKQWSSATPGYIIFLVDQSGSMAEKYAENKNKAEFTSLVINRTINELVNTNSDGEKVKDRVFVSIIGYGGKGGNSVDDVRSDYLSSFADNPLRIEKLKKKVSDGAGGLIEIDEEMPIFIEPLANGLTPMGDALSFAKQLIEGWLQKKPENPAPVIINVSDGMPYSGNNGNELNKALTVAKEIMAFQTTDGNPLIFNAHIGNGVPESMFEDSEAALYDDHAKFLFSISSSIPAAYKAAAGKHGLSVKENSRGFVSNAKPETLIQFINFGSSGGSDRIA
ncbi:hypothetical protein TH63_13485 [Rufibacter radiotolerans]|uniref:VWFA domain-containing protein n=1 Tax=Rufibacter radiotolerans TaxID=1379910 RepID=A0A0H4VKS3_9BACT|nr:vWA domain-containing protein [Rufibacter radiotolerans]AKQ46405.1 hypothetical protein TH63_13485 [Rufibacter radiotolerans]